MTAPARATIERLAPTGEGVARIGGKAHFIEGALPGEEVEYQTIEEKKRFSRARVVRIIAASPSRRPTDSHSARCGGTPWAHFDLDAARASKRELFLETLARHGGIDPPSFGELPIASSPLGYRIRNQFHAETSSAALRVGFYERRSHRVVPLEDCEIVSTPTAKKISRLFEELDPPAVGKNLTLETVESVEVDDLHRLAVRPLGAETGIPAGAPAPNVDINVGSFHFRVSPGSFFQVNRHRLAPFFSRIRDLAAQTAGKTALDACAGVGFLSGALIEAGYAVTAVESSAEAVADGEVNRIRSGWEPRLELVHRRLSEFLSSGTRSFDLVVADPPRGGLGEAAAPLASKCRATLIVVSCEPMSLANDLKKILPLGFDIRGAFLEDFFPLTPRVEAVVELVRK